MPLHAQLEITGPPSNGFYPVTWQGYSGWASAEYLASGTAPVDTPDPSPVSSFGFAWPIRGPITSYMSPRHPLGIDIGLWDREGAAIGAAAPGTVFFAGGNPCCGYGLYVVVQHADGFTTTYAHLSGVAVRIGQQVATGETIGFAGSTGYATGVHLHFEIRKDGAPLNPLAYLP